MMSLWSETVLMVLFAQEAAECARLSHRKLHRCHRLVCVGCRRSVLPAVRGEQHPTKENGSTRNLFLSLSKAELDVWAAIRSHLEHPGLLYSSTF